MRGGQWQVLLLMQALERRGHQQQLLARPGVPLLARARQAGLAVAPWRATWRLPAADVVHAHDARAHALAAWRARGAPLVVSRRVAFPVGRGLLSRWKYGRAARYIAVSRYVARELEFAGVPAEKIGVTFDGVRLPDMARAGELRAQFRQDLALPADAFVAGTLTSPREKPVAPLLEAAERRPRLQVLIAAAGAAQAEGLCHSNVRFLHAPDDISPFMFALDVFVHLSECEGLGSAALLAMAHGLPVIASDTGGLPEIVRPGETGWLVRNVAEEVGEALEQAFAGRARATDMGHHGRRFVEAEATDDIMAARTEAVYRKVLRPES
jgi:glycosyltransferase involved in cell wall biosynthesis